MVLAAPGPAKKTRRSRYPSSEWEKYRAVLRDLYMGQDKSLHETMRTMRDTHGFDPRLVMDTPPLEILEGLANVTQRAVLQAHLREMGMAEEPSHTHCPLHDRRG